MFPTSNTIHVAVGPAPSSNALRVEAVANQTTKSVDVVLRRGGAIEGSVRLASATTRTPEKSVAGFAINAERKLGANSYARVGTPAHTDAQGHYRLEGLAPGEYIVFIGMGNELPVYAQETVRPSHAAVVRIQQSETQHLNIDLPPTTNLHRIQGRVNLKGAEPPQNALVRLYPTGEGGLTAASRLTAEHSFSFNNVPDGDFTVEVEFPPTSELVSVETAKGVIHMRMTPSLYSTAAKNIHVEGQDVTAVLLTPDQK
jgi:hypothetical protein